MNANTDRLYRDVQFLTSIIPARNYLNLEGLEEVCTYLKNEFEVLQLPIEEQLWEAEGNPYKNIIASYNPDKKKRLIVGAHYDVCGDQPGADDNASAVAGLLETARLVAESQPNIDYRIDFVAYCLEEPPFFATPLMGSYIHAASLKKAKAQVIGMICYEMIGYFSDAPNSQHFPIQSLAKKYPNTGNFIIVVGKTLQSRFSNKVYQLMKKGSQVDVQQINFLLTNSLAGMSDHRNYWKFGYKAVMINDTSFLRNPHYHQKTDTIDTLNFEKMTQVVNSAYRAVVGLG